MTVENRKVVSQWQQRTSAHSWRVVFGALFVCAWSGNQFSPLLIMYRDIDNYSVAAVTTFLAVYVLGLVPTLVFSGAVSDRIGRRPPMVFAVLAAVLGSALLAAGELGQAFILGGRVCAGAAVGTATAVGTTWLKELSKAPHDRCAEETTGARRATLAFTLGSALGALVAGCIAQWGPWPHELPFILHLLVTIPFFWLLRGALETRTPAPSLPLRSGLNVTSARHRRFLQVVLVHCPWLFIACGMSYGYQPVLLAEEAGDFGLAYATLLSVVSLSTGAVIQPLAKRIHSASSARGVLVSMLILLVGLGTMAGATAADNLLIGVAASVVLGAGFGIGLVSGLLEVQRIAPPHELAMLTGIFYAVAYTGFAMPTVLAALTPPFTTIELYVMLACLLVLSMVVVAGCSRKHPAMNTAEAR